jgi:cytochrome c oxidase subunit 3
MSPDHASHFESLAKQEHAARLGMWAFLGSETLLFAGLFALYAAYRAMAPAEFREALAHNTRAFGTINTMVLLTSSFTVAMAVGAVQGARVRSAVRWLLATIALGATFLVVKGIEYGIHIHEGSLPGAAYRFAEAPTYGGRLFYTLYWLMTGLHALHVTGGLLALAWLTRRTRQGAYTPARHVHLEMGALYWHLVDVVWIFLWPLLYLMR